MYGDPLVNAVQAGHSVIRGRRQEGEKGQQQRHRCTMLKVSTWTLDRCQSW
jgi:hypothetical protein